MNKMKPCLMLLAVLAFGILSGCATNSTQSPDITADLRKALDQAGLQDVSTGQDRENHVVTLGGHVASAGDKQQAQAIATQLAGIQVVRNQIEILPVGGVKDTKAIDTDLDKGIERNLDAVLIQNQLHDDVKYEVKNFVVTLTGDVRSETLRRQAEQIATTVPNVQQVVNELQIKKQVATSSQ
jgi:osmotically-inducible protein OsmY